MAAPGTQRRFIFTQFHAPVHRPPPSRSLHLSRPVALPRRNRFLSRNQPLRSSSIEYRRYPLRFSLRSLSLLDGRERRSLSETARPRSLLIFVARERALFLALRFISAVDPRGVRVMRFPIARHRIRARASLPLPPICTSRSSLTIREQPHPIGNAPDRNLLRVFTRARIASHCIPLRCAAPHPVVPHLSLLYARNERTRPHFNALCVNSFRPTNARPVCFRSRLFPCRVRRFRSLGSEPLSTPRVSTAIVAPVYAERIDDNWIIGAATKTERNCVLHIRTTFL